MKFKNRENNFAMFRDVRWLISALLVGSLLFVFSYALPSLAQRSTASRVTETVTVSFTDYQAVTTTENYTGELLIVVSGIGKASGSDFTDAFYRFTDNNILLETPVSANEFGLEIDGGIASTLLESVPEYALDHVYIFSYDVGEEARPVGFRIADGALQDNTGEFIIRIVPFS